VCETDVVSLLYLISLPVERCGVRVSCSVSPTVARFAILATPSHPIPFNSLTRKSLEYVVLIESEETEKEKKTII
jgi:hypothetical protein